jgi:SAM-dependent methyltransferase
MIEHCPACGGELKISATRPSTRFSCNECHTITIPERRSYTYTENYSENRGHYLSQIKSCKTKSYQSHLRSADLQSLAGLKILEFGFGSGVFLQLAKELNADTYGIEIQKDLSQQATLLDIPEKNLSQDLGKFQASNLKFDAVFYFDSFEHVLEPLEHLKKLNELSRPGTKALVVLPQADSISRYMLKSFWPHDIPDHWVFYSKKGLIHQWKNQGWSVRKIFSPQKNITVEMILLHWGFQPSGALLNLLRRIPPFWFNIGEMGVVFEKT